MNAPNLMMYERVLYISDIRVINPYENMQFDDL